MLPKKHRVRKTSEYSKIFKKGKRFRTPYFNFTVYQPRTSLRTSKKQIALPRFGFVAGKKVGGAIQRNRAKRLLREAVRVEFPMLKNNFEGVFIAYDSILKLNHQKTTSVVKNVFNKASLYHNENPTSSNG